MHVNNVFVCGPKFIIFFSPNVGGVVVDQLLFQFSICRSVPEIVAIKVESCQTSRRIVVIFSPSQILGGRPSKNRTHVITLGSRHVVWKKFCEDRPTPTTAEVMDAHTLNFKPNFKFSRLIFFFGGGGPPVHIAVCASKPLSIYSACKNLMVQHYLRAEIQSPEKCLLGWVNMHVNNFIVCGPKFTNFFSPNVGGVVVDQLLFRPPGTTVPDGLMFYP